MPNLNDFLSRIQADHTFYLQFRQDPEEALAPYELSAEERTAVTESREQLWTPVGRSNSCWKYYCAITFCLDQVNSSSTLRQRTGVLKFGIRSMKSAWRP